MKVRQIGREKPIVIDLRSEKRGKRRYSEGLEDLQRLERDATRIQAKVIRALDRGLDAYREARDDSARNKRDGALRDFGVNAAEGVSTMLEEMSGVPREVARALNRRGARGQARDGLRLASRIGRRLR